jgi:hypothetical protein
MDFTGMNMHLWNVMKLSDAKTRVITAENVYGQKGRGGMADLSETPQPEVVRIGQEPSIAKGPARDLGRKWKVRPCITVPAGATATIMDVDGPGVIQHIWITVNPDAFRDLILRMYWDGEETPSVESPVGDFFCNGWKKRANVLAMPINVNPSGARNCSFPMPFRLRAKVTIENRSPQARDGFFYAITYAQTAVGDNDACFHARFRRTNPLAYLSDYTILDGVRGRGQYVGTYMAWQQNAAGWWGEGEIKFFLDGDGEFPTICGTGTEDYFGGAWGFSDASGREDPFSTAFLGLPLVRHVDNEVPRLGLYRWHVMDPVCFAKDLKVTIQALGWWPGGKYQPLTDDIASTAFWYQTLPHAKFPPLPGPNERFSR